MLDRDYYRRAIQAIEARLGNDIEYHLFSDEPDFFKGLFPNRRTILHDDDPYLDWLALSLSPHLISSNSTFCWTASLFTRGILVQPKDGTNYQEASGSVPYGFALPNAIQIGKPALQAWRNRAQTTLNRVADRLPQAIKDRLFS